MNNEPAKNNSLSRTVLEVWKKIFIGSTLLIFIIILAIIFDGRSSVEEPNISSKNPPVYDGCVVTKTPIEYKIINKKVRESDVKNKFIQECYILIKKIAPTVSELEQFAISLGKNNNNIEFRIFDNKQAYQLYELYVATNREEEAPQKDWDFLWTHYLASYLKANTSRRNNYLQPLSDIYRTEGQTSIPAIQINN